MASRMFFGEKHINVVKMFGMEIVVYILILMDYVLTVYTIALPEARVTAYNYSKRTCHLDFRTLFRCLILNTLPCVVRAAKMAVVCILH